MDEEAGEAIYGVTGHLPSMFFMPAKLRWWQAHQPRTADRVAKAATLGAWATHELTTVLAETPETLAEAGLLDIDTRLPATDLLARLGLDPSLIPGVVATGEATGKLRADRFHRTATRFINFMNSRIGIVNRHTFITEKLRCGAFPHSN